MGRVRAAVGIPVIGSLNGTTAESWLTFSRLIEQAGASAIELNMYEVVADFRVSSEAVEHQLVHVIADLKKYLKIPIAVKLSPYLRRSPTSPAASTTPAPTRSSCSIASTSRTSTLRR